MTSQQTLVNKPEFTKLLANYRPSQPAIERLRTANLTLLVAPTAGGRNTIMDHLSQRYGYQIIVSDTTRPPRTNNGVLETDGQQYWFKTETEFLANLRHAKLLEAAIIHGQQVSGINASQLGQLDQPAKPLITDIDIQGYLSLASYSPTVRAVFILPPSFETWLDRLTRRGTLSPPEKLRRLISAQTELTASLELTKLSYVINDDLDQACQLIDRLAKLADLKVNRSKSALQLAQELLERLAVYIADHK